MTIKRVLLPTDFSETSLHALQHAITLAKSFKAKIIVLFVMKKGDYATEAGYPWGPSIGEQRRAAKEQLAQLERTIRGKNVPVETILAAGAPYQGVINAAKARKADLIVMSTRGRSGLPHLMMGSVTEKVVRSASCPVLTVRGPGQRRSRAQRAKPMKKKSTGRRKA